MLKTLSFVLVMTVTACFQMEHFSTGSGDGGGGTDDGGGIDGSVAPPGGGGGQPGTTQVQWTFTGPVFIENVMTSELKLPTTHMSVRGVRQDFVLLGGPDYQNKKAADHMPTPEKAYKSVYHFLQACLDGLQNQTVATRLFPGGTGNWNNSSFNAIYKHFLGRFPDSTEIQSLLTLTGQVSGPNRSAAVCVVVLNSIEFMSRN